MSRTVLNVVEEGIKKVGLDKICDPYEQILIDFYKNCCVNDTKRDYTPRSGKYNKIYSCLDRRRVPSTLEININDENIINVKQSNDEFSNILTLSPEFINSIGDRYNLLRVGILSLEKTSSIDCLDNIKTTLDKLTISSTCSIFESYKDDKESYYRYFFYKSSNNELSFYTDSDFAMMMNISFEDYVKKMYRRYSANIDERSC